jgi:aspartyl-tRNA(Asn)/glutamyl-tRNA(Gln) amidotransferase subunit A
VTAELHWWPASDLSQAFRRRELSPVDVLRHLSERINRLNPTLNAFISFDEQGALDSARQAERALLSGQEVGPLHGVPVAIKDVIDVAGMRTTCHSRILIDNMAREDSEVVRRLRRAGAVVLGKLSTHEFATGGPSFDLPFPPARNPWNTDHHPGGSSSGAGAGLAAGLFPLAIGTDTGGSVRHPASACAAVGLKPTYGRVSLRGVFPLSYSLDHVGPLARTVGDCALLLDAIAGHDPSDPTSVEHDCKGSDADLQRGIRGLRIGFIRHFHRNDKVAHPEVSAALEKAADLLAAEGAEVIEMRLSPLQVYSAVNSLILRSEAWSIHAPWLRQRPGDYGRLARQRLMSGAFISAADYIAAQRFRSQLIHELEGVFQGADVLLAASSMDPPCRIDDTQEISRTYRREAREPFNVTGHPALAMPSGALSSDGLPLSLQLVGRYFDERTIFRVAAAFERAASTKDLRPRL